MHDDDECADVHQRLVYGVASLCPMREATIETLSRTRAASFYFASCRVRMLQLPALVGLILHLLDAHFGGMGAERNATREAIALVRSEAAEAASGVMELYGGMDAICLNAGVARGGHLRGRSAAAVARRRRPHPRVADGLVRKRHPVVSFDEY